jgi:SAM-dependent methyltransferase
VTLNDPEVVQREYASERGLAGRKAAYRFAEGPNPYDIVLQAMAEARPARILEVGCGEGELAERMQAELGAEVAALDQSKRMVELTRARGVAAIVGDVQELPFVDGEFDCALAAWMLYHVPDLDRALSEVARVLRPAGRLVAVTIGLDHMGELRRLAGAPPPDLTFHADNGAQFLGRHFMRVERRDATGWVAFPDRAAAQEYVDATITWGRGRQLPQFDGGLRVRSTPYVFVADM